MLLEIPFDTRENWTGQQAPFFSIQKSRFHAKWTRTLSTYKSLLLFLSPYWRHGPVLSSCFSFCLACVVGKFWATLGKCPSTMMCRFLWRLTAPERLSLSFMLSRNEPIEGRRSMGVITASPFSRRDGRSHARDRRQQSPARAPKTNGVPEGFEWHSACPLSLSTCCRFHTVVFLFTACPFAHSMCVMLIFLIIDLRFPLDGSVRLHFSTSPESRLMGVNETHTRFTVESSTGKMRKNSSWLTWPLIIIISSFVFPPFWGR